MGLPNQQGISGGFISSLPWWVWSDEPFDLIEWASNQIDVSMGRGDIPTVELESPWIPELVPEAPPFKENPLPPEIDRRDIPPVQEVALSDEEWFRRMHPDLVYAPPGREVVPTFIPALPGTEERAQQAPLLGEMSIHELEEPDDVGWITDTLGNVYDVVDASVGGILPGGVPFGQVPITGGIPAVVDFATGGAAPPVVINQPVTGVPVTTCATDDPMRGMVYKKVCGTYKWVKVKRRRRRALVTQTDLRGLAALKGVLGQGKAMDVWIATHS